MTKTQNVYWRGIILYGILVTAWFFWAAFGSQISRAVFRLPLSSVDDRTIPLYTSVDYRFQERFERTLQRYTQLSAIYQEERSTAVPGLENTRTGSGSSRQMVPQGICIAGDYMLITAYDNGSNGSLRYDSGYQAQNSVIYVMSNQDAADRSFLTVIELPDVNHVGGIAFDGKNVWIAKSTTGCVSALSYETIQEAASSGQESYSLKEYEQNIYVGVTASFLSCYDGRLWVGTYRSALSGSGSLNSYRIVESAAGTRLSWEQTIKIPSFAQGVTFARLDGVTYMALTASCGRYSDSKVYIYEAVKEEEGLTLYAKAQYKFPPMAEELISDGEHTYFLFESAATCYSTSNYRKCAYPVDRICAVSNSGLFR